MAISKIKAMSETLKKMESMRDSVKEECNLDITEKRKAAFREICKYMNELSVSLSGYEVTIEARKNAVRRMFTKENTGLTVGFNARYRTQSNSYEKSPEVRNWWIAGIEDGNVHRYSYYGYKYIGRKGKAVLSDYNNFIDDSILETDDFEKCLEKNLYIDRWNDGVVPLIENWVEIKENIEGEVEKALKEKMNNACMETEKDLVSYKIADEFTV